MGTRSRYASTTHRSWRVVCALVVVLVGLPLIATAQEGTPENPSVRTR